MIKICLLLTSLITTGKMILCDFDTDSKLENWVVVDDVVMGGISEGQLNINEQGNAVFKGRVSTENNGGFSSVRHSFETIETLEYSKVMIRLKGDGKQYQFRVKTAKYDRHSYVYDFKTSGDWEIIEIPLSEMEPRFRGRILDMPNYPRKILEEIAFLIGNKKEESFQLEIDHIILD